MPSSLESLGSCELLEGTVQTEWSGDVLSHQDPQVSRQHEGGW